MKTGGDPRQRYSGLTFLIFALLLSLAAMSGLTLYLLEQRLIAVLSHAFALGIIAAAIIPLTGLLIWSGSRLRQEWLRTREREQWLATTLRSIGDGVISTDAAERITFLNAAAERITGCPESEARGLPLGEVVRAFHITSGERAELPALIAMRTAQPASGRNASRVVARDNTERTVAIDAAPTRADDGAIVGCVIVLRDVTERALADAALQASQEMFAMITEDVSDMITIVDLEGRRLYNSTSYARLLTAPAKLYLTDSFADVHPEDRERMRQIFAETIRTGVGQRTDYRLIDSAGRDVHIESVGSVIRGPDGKPQKLLVVSRDNTERYIVEQQVHREKEFSESLVNSMPGLLYLYDARRIILRWNKNFEAITKYTADEIRALDPLDFFRPEQKQLVHNRMLKCFEEGSADVECYIVAKDGTERPFYVTGLRVQIDGRPCMLGVGIDISERVQAEETSRATMRRLGRQNRALTEHARSTPLVEKDLQAAFGEITEIAANTLELKRASIWLYRGGEVMHCVDLFEQNEKRHSSGVELQQRDYPSYFAALGEERAIAASEARTDPRTREFAAAYLEPLGITSLLDAPIRSGGKMVGVLCNEHTGPARAWTPDEENFAGSMADLISLALEVDQRRRAEALLRDARDHLEIKVAERTHDLEQANGRLKELDRLKSEFLATMSHELRTPLNSIIGFTGILRQGLAGPLNEEQDKQLGMVHFSARHLLGLINDLLDLSRIESGKMEVHPETFRLAEVVEEVVQSLQPNALHKRVELKAQVAPRDLEVRTDRKKVFQILLNLANNAVKFTERGHVRIEVRAADGEVTITVIDTGIGIRPESIGGLFQAFRQVDGSARRVYEGTGLGLYLCKKLATLLGGQIRAESDFGVGSRFTVVLPALPPTATES